LLGDDEELCGLDALTTGDHVGREHSAVAATTGSSGFASFTAPIARRQR
jgi:hypothetical protein